MSVRFTRPDSASDLFSADKAFRDDISMFKTMTQTAPAAAASLPTPGAVAQEYTEAGSRVANTIICAGTVAAISADTIGVLTHDAIASSPYATYAIQGGIVTLNTGVEAYAKGLDVYITPLTMVATLVSGASTIYIGKCQGAIKTNPDGYPAGSYVDVLLDQTEA